MKYNNVEGYRGLTVKELVEEYFFLTELNEKIEENDQKVELDIKRVLKELGKHQFAKLKK